MKVADFIRLKYLYKCRLDNLNKWEEEFIMQIAENHTYSPFTPSNRQLEKVREIYKKQREIVKRRVLWPAKKLQMKLV